MGYKYSNDVIKTKEYNLLSLPEVKPHLNVGEDWLNDDILLLRQINQAISLAEDKTGIDITTTHCTKEYFDYNGIGVRIEECPLIEVTSVKIYDEENTETELTEWDDYYVVKEKTAFQVIFNDDSIECSKLQIKFDTGYDRQTLPPSLQAAIEIKVNDLYDMERTSFTVGVNYKDNGAFERCLSGYTVIRW